MLNFVKLMELAGPFDHCTYSWLNFSDFVSTNARIPGGNITHVKATGINSKLDGVKTSTNGNIERVRLPYGDKGVNRSSFPKPKRKGGTTNLLRKAIQYDAKLQETGSTFSHDMDISDAL